METEVKLCFANKENLFKVAESDLFREFSVTKESVPMTLENYYLDTEDRKVLSRNGSVRRRLVSGGRPGSYRPSQYQHVCICDRHGGRYVRKGCV